jgi:hypothetical protein
LIWMIDHEPEDGAVISELLRQRFHILELAGGYGKAIENLSYLQRNQLLGRSTIAYMTLTSLTVPSDTSPESTICQASVKVETMTESEVPAEDTSCIRVPSAVCARQMCHIPLIESWYKQTLCVFTWALKSASHCFAPSCIFAQFLAKMERSITKAGVRSSVRCFPLNAERSASLDG